MSNVRSACVLLFSQHSSNSKIAHACANLEGPYYSSKKENRGLNESCLWLFESLLTLVIPEEMNSISTNLIWRSLNKGVLINEPSKVTGKSKKTSHLCNKGGRQIS